MSLTPIPTSKIPNFWQWLLAGAFFIIPFAFQLPGKELSLSGMDLAGPIFLLFLALVSDKKMLFQALGSWGGVCLLLVLVFYTLATLLAGLLASGSGMRLVRFSFILTTFYVMWAVSSYPKLVVRLAGAFVAGTLLSVILALAGYSLDKSWAMAGQMNYMAGGLVVESRAGGLFGDSSAFGFQLVGLIIFSQYFAWVSLRGSNTRRVLGFTVAVSSILLGMTGMVFSGSRTAQLALAMCFVYLVLHNLFVRRRALVVLSIVAVAILGGSIFASLFIKSDSNLLRYEHAVARFVDLWNGDTYDLSSGRFDLWGYYLSKFSGDFIFGIGYKALSLSHGLPPDNIYVSGLVEGGFLTLLGLIGFSLTLIISGIWYDWKNKESFGWAGMTAIAWVTAGFFVDTFTFYASAPGLLALGALFMSSPSARLVPFRRPVGNRRVPVRGGVVFSR